MDVYVGVFLGCAIMRNVLCFYFLLMMEVAFRGGFEGLGGRLIGAAVRFLLFILLQYGCFPHEAHRVNP